MGFYVHILISFPLCQETGKPYYYGKDFTKIYDLSGVEPVPEKYRRFLYDGYTGLCIYQNYMRDDHYIDSAEAVFDNFPDWEEVEDCLSDEAKKHWTKEDHDLFYEAISWLTLSCKGYATITWG